MTGTLAIRQSDASTFSWKRSDRRARIRDLHDLINLSYETTLLLLNLMLSETLWSRLQHTDDKLTIRQDTYNAFPKITLSKSSNNDIILIVDIFFKFIHTE